ncbi:hypothetical protein PsorP6_005179 [Peronosclerospora sorghi]|uniref:Uncharacterized protein n=1 Tax=Peronosclerospora sorghi TaxID=230839 RepID=A0ACC0W4X9_9STRA|nr:hypothetical protein PsorP6_005179 [Peronosclerospora sorghi]
MLGGARGAYATAARFAVVRFVGSMSASADVLALATTEFDLSSISEGSTVTVKWRGKLIFIKHWTPKELESSNQVDVSNLRDPETDGARVQKPEWLVVLGNCTHLGCVPTSDEGEYGRWFCPATARIMICSEKPGAPKPRDPSVQVYWGEQVTFGLKAAIQRAIVRVEIGRRATIRQTRTRT